MVKKRWIELLGILLFFVGIIHALPFSYTLHQIYEVSGQMGEIQTLPQRLSQEIVSLLDQFTLRPIDSRDVRCSPLLRAYQYRCEVSVQGIRKAFAFNKVLVNQIPPTLGWIPSETIQNKLAWAEGQQTKLNQELGYLNQDLLQPTTFPSDQPNPVDREKQKLSNLQSNLERNQLQLQRIEEGTSLHKNKPLFQEKRKQLSQAIELLKAQVEETQKKMVLLEEIQNRKNWVVERQKQIEIEIKVIQEKIQRWKIVLSKAPESPIVADPENFQVAALLNQGTMTPHRNWDHLPWSILVGLCFFGWIRKNGLAEEPSSSNSLSDEI